MLARIQEYEDTPTPLIAGAMPVDSKKIILVTGEKRTRGAVLGRIAGAASNTAWANNAANTGTMGAVTVGAGVKEGTYRVLCIEPAADAGTFAIEDPDGKILPLKAVVGVAFVGPINFTIADGATNFVPGEGFDVVVAAGTKYKLAASAATDGSAIPRVVLADDCDATSADAEAMAITRGDLNTAALTIGTGHTVDSIRDDLQKAGITLVAPIR